MENKKYILYLFVLICVCFLLVGYFNYESIVDFFYNKQWEFAESFATIQIDNVQQVDSGKPLLVRTNDKVSLYGSDAKVEYEEGLITTGLIINSCEDYMVIVAKDASNIYLFKGSSLLWKNNFKWNILNASVNKNGYVTVIYSQSGYKSSIKIFKPSGEELFTTILASTYALDAEMSYDNKVLYIAEIDTEGIKLKSNIKVIEVAKVEMDPNMQNQVKTITLGLDDMITDIEYTADNNLLILKDSGIALMDNKNNLVPLGEFNVKNTLFATVDNLNFPISIEKVSTGIFTNETVLKIYKNDEMLEVNIEKTPQNIDTMGNKIALNLGDEVLFINTNGHVVKRYELKNQLMAVKMYNKGSLGALVFRDRIELIHL